MVVIKLCGTMHYNEAATPIHVEDQVDLQARLVYLLLVTAH